MNSCFVTPTLDSTCIFNIICFSLILSLSLSLSNFSPYLKFLRLKLKLPAARPGVQPFCILQQQGHILLLLFSAYSFNPSRSHEQLPPACLSQYSSLHSRQCGDITRRCLRHRLLSRINLKVFFNFFSEQNMSRIIFVCFLDCSQLLPSRQ